MTNLKSILKSRDITLPTKTHLVKALVFPVVMYGCESWIRKKAEHWKTDAFELWCWRRLLRAPWTARWSNQSILKELSPEYSLEGLKMKLKLYYFDQLMQRTDSLEKTLPWYWRSEVAQSCPPLCNHMDCSLPDSAVHELFQTRIPEWVAISFFRGSFWPGDQTWVSCIAGRCFTIWATREA